MNRAGFLFLLLVVVMISGALAAQNQAQVQAQVQDQDLQSLGQDISTVIAECESCHGPAGVSDQNDIPSLAGLPAATIQESLDQFYFYERHCPTTTYRHGEHESSPPLNMCSIASGLSDEEVLALAEYFSAFPVPPGMPAEQ